MSCNPILLKKSKHKHDKWRIIAITVTFLFFCASLTLVAIDNITGIFDLNNDINNCSTKAIQKKNPKYFFQKTFYQQPILNTCQTKVNDQCEITCEGIFDIDIVKKTDLTSCGDSKIFLSLSNVEFTEQTIEEGWLAKFPKPISKLKINSRKLNFLGKRSFAGHPFEIITILTLVNTNITYLERDSFDGSFIEQFEFRFDSLQTVNFENGSLEYLANNLQSLQINLAIIEPQALKNLTGAIKFPRLEILDLRFNLIKYIMNNTFKASGLKQLFLSCNKLQYLEKEAFLQLSDKITLDIKDNYLSTLPEGIFSGFINGSIQIMNNHWQCDCNLLWFRTFYIENKKNYFNNGLEQFICTTKDGLKDYTEVDFCPFSPSESSTTISTIASTGADFESTTVTSTTASTFQPSVGFRCEDCLKNLPVYLKLPRFYTHTVNVRNGSVTYDFYQIKGTPYYDIHLRNSVGSDYMIWINNNNQDDIGCVFNIQEVVTLGSLSYDQDYILCLLKQNEDRVSPFDCTSLVVPPIWDNTPWIFNKDKTLLIALFVIIVFVLTAISIATIYCMIRKKRKKENRSIVENLYMTPPSLYSINDGYLQPRLYERIKSIRFSKKRLNRKLSTISEKDSESAFNVVYNVSEINERELYEPPPLPPNHPSTWKENENWVEMCPSAPEEKKVYRSCSVKRNNKHTSPIPETLRSKSIS